MTTMIAVGVLILAHSFEAKPPQPPSDPDAAIARYQKECAGGSKSASCQQLRVEVEAAFLADLVELRGAGEKVDPELYRAAASAESPQLVCLGLRQLAGPKMTPEDQALFADALESPYRGTRKTVIQLARYRDPVKGLMERVAPETLRDGDLSESCLDGLRDAEPDPKLAGGYPGARYRYFASSPARGWFTTPDAPEKVIAFFAKGGKKALTGAEMKKAAQPQIDQAAMMKAAQSGDKAKIQELIQAASTPRIDWTRGIEGTRGAGEIFYVTLSPTQVVAVFKDDVLRATSIVAPAPPAPPAASFDPVKIKRDILARKVFSR